MNAEKIAHLTWDIAYTEKLKMRAVGVRTLALASGFTRTANAAQVEIDDCIHDAAMFRAELAELQK